MNENKKVQPTEPVLTGSKAKEETNKEKRKSFKKSENWFLVRRRRKEG